MPALKILSRLIISNSASTAVADCLTKIVNFASPIVVFWAGSPIPFLIEN